MSENKMNVMELPDGGSLQKGDTVLVIRDNGDGTQTAVRTDAGTATSGIVDSEGNLTVKGEVTTGTVNGNGQLILNGSDVEAKASNAVKIHADEYVQVTAGHSTSANASGSIKVAAGSEQNFLNRKGKGLKLTDKKAQLENDTEVKLRVDADHQLSVNATDGVKAVGGLTVTEGLVADTVSVGGHGLSQYAQSYVAVISKEDAKAKVDGVEVDIPSKRRTLLYPTKSLSFSSNASAIIHIDTSHWDTSGVSRLSFGSCSSVTSLDTSGWDTSGISSFVCAFLNFKSLVSLDTSGWDTSNVTSFEHLFNACNSLTHVDTSGWDTSKVKSLDCSFLSCYVLTSLDLSGWDVSNVTLARYTFEGCRKITTLIGTHTLAEVEDGTVTALNGMSVDFSLSPLSSVDRASILAVIKGLADLTGKDSQTLMLGTTLKAKLTDDDIAIATGKNWTVV